MVLMLAMFLLMLTESQSFDKIMFETISAFATVGLSTGITASLSEPGKLILVLVMICRPSGAPHPGHHAGPSGGDPHPLSGRERLHGVSCSIPCMQEGHWPLFLFLCDHGAHQPQAALPLVVPLPELFPVLFPALLPVLVRGVRRWTQSACGGQSVACCHRAPPWAAR